MTLRTDFDEYCKKRWYAEVVQSGSGPLFDFFDALTSDAAGGGIEWDDRLDAFNHTDEFPVQCTGVVLGLSLQKQGRRAVSPVFVVRLQDV